MPRVKLTDRNLLHIGEDYYIFDAGKMLLSEAIAAEKVAKMTWAQILVGLQGGVAQSIRPVVWLLRKRSNPKLRIEEVEFAMDEYELLDPDFHPDYWVLTDEDDELGLEVDDDGNIVRPPDDEPELSEDPKAESSSTVSPPEG